MNLKRYGERPKRFGLLREHSGITRNCPWRSSSPLDIHPPEPSFRFAAFGYGLLCFLECTTTSIKTRKRFSQREKLPRLLLRRQKTKKKDLPNLLKKGIQMNKLAMKNKITLKYEVNLYVVCRMPASI